LVYKSKEPVNPDQATFMDFSVEQKAIPALCMCCQLQPEALLEYTLFSHQLLTKEEYEQEIKQYIENLGIQNFEIIEKKKVVFHDLLSFLEQNYQARPEYRNRWRVD
jgi:lycopene beta-cyclase